MKKILLTLTIISFSYFSNGQEKVITKREAKKVAKTINNSLTDMAKTIEKMDWNSLGDLINNTVAIIEKHTDAIVEIAQSVDTKQLEKNAEKIAEKVDESVDVEKLEKQLDNVSKTIEKAISEKNQAK